MDTIQKSFEVSANRRRLRRRQFAFTLVELLVVVGIIGVLVAILMPALQRARQQAVRVECASNLRQTYLAMVMYAQVYKEYPTMTTWAQEVASWGSEAIADGQQVIPWLLVVGRPPQGAETLTPQLLAKGKFLSAKAAQCPTTNSPQWPVAFDEFSQTPWFRYNGPNCNGWWEWNYGHGPDFLYYGWQWPIGDPAHSTHGVRYNERQHKNPGFNWYTHRALLCCPRMIVADPMWTITKAWEPHGTCPQSASSGIVVQMDNLSPIKDRNYCFTDGHVEYIQTR